MQLESEKTTRIRGKRIRLLPTPEQEVLFWKSAGTARWAFNFYLAEQERAYKEYLERGKKGKRYFSGAEVRKRINNELKPTTHQWLSEVGSNVMKQAVKEADKTYRMFTQGLIGKPKFKAKRRTKPSFYVNYESLSWQNGGFRGERLGFVRTSEVLPRLPKGIHYLNPWISFDGKYWFLSINYEVQEQPDRDLTGEYVGIDLGIKNLAICYASGADEVTIYKNINKTAKVRRLEKRLKQQNREQSRKLEANIAGYQGNNKAGRPIWKRPLRECKNLERQRRKIVLLYRRLKNIRNNYLHQTTNAIVKTKPSRIVIEDLHVTNMMRNRHLSKAIAEQKFHEFRRQLTYKCESHGIQLIVANRFYPSSKRCSCCGHVKRDLKLKDRVYSCPVCGQKIDRDVNAAVNLAQYFQSERA